MNGIIWNKKGLGLGLGLELGLIGNKKGSTSNGFESWGPSSTLPHPYDEVLDNTLNGIEDIEFTRMDTSTLSVNEESSVTGEEEKMSRRDKREDSTTWNHSSSAANARGGVPRQHRWPHHHRFPAATSIPVSLIGNPVKKK
ncbi:hypothetical protein L1987_20847 [Smallanthus sonchifolius]|uniref:Uncharacterized protein n=1 Tax=Smallanthus sonchifolius TaxID=185202 RepID=A0ACB9IUS5_9ASTR|nr:hypothetical protein L1987_20847 [Smallanthus sonchifolius]